MTQKKVEGMILAAGFGTRLRPLTDSIPKAIVEVAGKPLIFYALENMGRAGVSKVLINTHYLPELLEKKVRSKKWPFEIIFSFEPQILGTGGSIREAIGSLGDLDALLVQNADALIDADFPLLFETYFSTNPLSTMALKTVSHPEKYGVVATNQDNRVVDISSKVGYAEIPFKQRMFCGMQLLSPQIVDWMPHEMSKFCIVKDVLIPAITLKASVTAVENHGYFCDVGTMERLEEASAYKLKLCHGKTSSDRT